MAKGFGIAALICALLALVIPLVGIVVSGIAIVLAIIAALSGDRAFATATSLIAGINTFFLSPSVMLVLHTSPAAPVIGGFLFLCAAAPIGTVFVKGMLDQSSPQKDESLPERPANEPDGQQEPKPQQPVGTNANQSSPDRFTGAKPEKAAYRLAPDHSDLRFIRADRISSHDRPAEIEKRSLARISQSIGASGALAVNATRKWERLLLIPFLGNYVINNIVAGSVSLIPASTDGGLFTPQYITYIILAAIVVALLSCWYLIPLPRMNAMKWGIIFGVGGFTISIFTTLVSSISGTVARSGSLEQVASDLQSFGPFLWSSSTLLPLCFWVIPATLIGCAMQFFQIRPSPSLSMR
jgi:hypothetical protein